MLKEDAKVNDDSKLVDMDQSMAMLDVSRIEVIRGDDPRFGKKYPCLKAQTKLNKDKVQAAAKLSKKGDEKVSSKLIDDK